MFTVMTRETLLHYESNLSQRRRSGSRSHYIDFPDIHRRHNIDESHAGILQTPLISVCEVESVRMISILNQWKRSQRLQIPGKVQISLFVSGT